jgi:hypothetical protein
MADSLSNPGTDPDVADALENAPMQVAMNDKFTPLNPMQPAYSNPGGHETSQQSINPGRAEILDPPSPNIAKAINRVRAWIKEKEQRGMGSQPALEMNIQMMQRGGKIGEGMAKHMLDMFQPHPLENGPLLQAPAIEGDFTKMEDD